jgi:argininosuccinate lyase
VLYAIGEGKALDELTMEEFKSFSDAFAEDIYDAISIENCIKAKQSEGSTSFESVRKQLDNIKSK